MRRIVRENPGEIMIVAVGPLTNVALALRDDPELAGMIPQIAIMGGSLSGGNITPAAEFNLYVDPEAARIVFDAHIPLTPVGLDVTRKYLLSEAQIQQLEGATNPVSQAAGKIMRATFERMKQPRRARRAIQAQRKSSSRRRPRQTLPPVDAALSGKRRLSRSRRVAR